MQKVTAAAEEDEQQGEHGCGVVLGSCGDVVQGRIVVVLIGDGEVVTVVAGVATGLGGGRWWSCEAGQWARQLGAW